jgi:LPS sulfotransferase NodH
MQENTHPAAKVIDVRAIRFMVLMTWGRVGSNLVMNIIAQHGPSKLANESFNSIKGTEEQLAWYRDFYEFASERPTKPLIGSKQNVLALSDPEGMKRRFMEDGIRVIRMRRDNLVKATISQIRAEQYAAKTREETGTALWAVHKGRTGLGPSTIDVKLMLQRIEIMKRAQDALSVFSGMSALDLEYEEINGALPDVIERVRGFLNLDAKRPVKVNFEKATSDDLSEAVVNFDEVKRSLAGTRYAEQI